MKNYIGITLPKPATFYVSWQVLSLEKGAAPGARGELPLRLDLANHSPDGFAWGYGGSGPSQLALALLADATGDDRVALRLHHRFLQALIAGLNQDKDWAMSDTVIQTFARLLDGV